MNKIITISRQFGSGGHFIGEQVANKLGIQFYDKKIIEKIAEETGFSEKFIREQSEYSSSKNPFAFGLIGRDQNGESIADKIYAAQAKIIRELSHKEDCVIIGRCADYILKDEVDIKLLNVFICADEGAKAERIQKLYEKTETEAIKLIRDMDKKRKLHYEFYTDRTWGNLMNYSLILNSSELGREKCIDLICSL